MNEFRVVVVVVVACFIFHCLFLVVNLLIACTYGRKRLRQILVEGRFS